MVVEVVAAEVVDVAGRDQRPPDLARDPDDALVGLVLLGHAVLLDLEVDVLGAEHLQQLVGVAARLGRGVVDEPPAEARLEAAGERDDAVGVALEQRQVDVGLAAPVALEVAGRAELDEVAEALVAGGQQREVVALVADLLGLAVVDEVGLEPDDRLDPVALAGLVVLDRAVHHAVVGEPERGLAEGRGALGQSVDPAGPVEDGVLGMDVEMGERRVRHRAADYTSGLGQTGGPESGLRRNLRGRRGARLRPWEAFVAAGMTSARRSSQSSTAPPRPTAV